MDGKNRRLQGLVHWRKWHCPRHSQIKMANGYHSEIHTIIRMRVYISSNQTQDFAWLGNVCLKHIELYSVPTGIFQTIFCIAQEFCSVSRKDFYRFDCFASNKRNFFILSFVFAKISFHTLLKVLLNPFLLEKRGLIERNGKSYRNYFSSKNTLDIFLARLQTCFVTWMKDTVPFNETKASIQWQECYLLASCFPRS